MNESLIKMIVHQGSGPITVEIKLIKPNVLAIANRVHSQSHRQWLFTSSLRAI